MSIRHLSSADFNEFIGEGRTLVDFWAGWCMPCKMIAPVIEGLADDFEGKVSIGKVDIDKENALAARFDIMSIPTVIVFQDGVEVKRIIGAQPKASYEAAIQA